MNSLPVVGLTVTDVIAGHSVQICLSTDALIQLEQPFTYIVEDGPRVFIDPVQGKPDMSAVRIRGTRISTAAYSDAKVLTLQFSSGDSILLTPDGSGYEAWHVTTRDEVIVGWSWHQL